MKLIVETSPLLASNNHCEIISIGYFYTGIYTGHSCLSMLPLPSKRVAGESNHMEFIPDKSKTRRISDFVDFREVHCLDEQFAS